MDVVHGAVARLRRYTPVLQYEDDIQLESPIENVWALPEPEPTNLIAAWPHQQVPLLADVVAAMEHYLGKPVKVLEELDTDAPEIKWTAALQLPDVPGLKYPLMIWVEPAKASADDPPAAAGCPWVVGVETLLDSDDPLGSYTALVRTIGGSLPGVPAMLDINTLVWRDRRELQREYFAEDDIDPPAETLWTIHAVQQQAGASTNAQPLTWLHTHGLWRCGLPELEILEVPASDTPAGAMLLNDIAEMLLEQPPTQPHDVYVIGAGLAVRFQPWEEVAPYVADDVPGGVPDREGPQNRAHAGVRAVVCATEPAGSYRKVWTWPEEVIRRLQSGNAALFMTTHASQRQAKLAALHMPAFREAFTSADAADATFLAKAAYEFRAGEQTHREHLWLQVQSLDGDEIHGTLLNEPVGDLPLKRGQAVTVGAQQITDWQVQKRGRTFGPDAADALRQSIGN